MKRKIFLALLWSVSSTMHAATHKVARTADIGVKKIPAVDQVAKKTPTLDQAARRAKARDDFNALPIDTSFDFEVPVPPPRVESQIPKGGSLAEWSRPDLGVDHTFEPIRDGISPTESAAPHLSMKDWLSPTHDDTASASLPILMHKLTRESSAAPPVPMRDWLASPRDESRTPELPIGVSLGSSSTIRARFSGLVSRLKNPSPTSVTSLHEPSALHHVVAEKQQNVLGKFAAATKKKIQAVKERALSVRERLKSTVEERIVDLVNDLVDKAGADAALAEVVTPVNDFLRDQFGTTLADYNIPQKLAEEAKKQAIAKVVEKSTGLVKREQAIAFMNAGTRTAREVQGAVRTLGREMGLTPEVKAQMRAELASFKKTIMNAKQRTIEAMEQLRVKPTVEE